jgi:uncharacterized RDD family membrane protein YckC
MLEDIQRANAWKRISAYLFDIIFVFIIMVGVAYLTSIITNYDHYTTEFEKVEAKYEEEYGIDFDITKEIYEGLSPEEAAKYPADYLDRLSAAGTALGSDRDAQYYYAMIMSLIVLIFSVSVIVSFAIYEFAIPLFLKNGQTLGKKIFAIGIIRTDMVKISGVEMFTRAMLGKCTVELLLPLVMIFSMGMVGTVAAAGISILSLCLLVFTKNRTPIHDVLAHTVAVDISSQRIFDSVDDLIAYKNKLHVESISEN